MCDLSPNKELEKINRILDELFTVEAGFIKDFRLFADKLPELAKNLASKKKRELLANYQTILSEFLNNHGLNLVGIKRNSQEWNDKNHFSALLDELNACFNNQKAIGLLSLLIQYIDDMTLLISGVNFSVKKGYPANIYLIKPMQKVVQYRLLFGELAKAINNCPDLEIAAIQRDMSVLLESARRLILFQDEAIARRTIHEQIKKKWASREKSEVIRELLTQEKQEAHRVPFYWEVILSQCFPSQCKLSSHSLVADQVLLFESEDFQQIFGKLSSNPLLGGIKTLDSSNFDANQMQKSYERTQDCIWLTLLAAKPIDAAFTVEDKLRNYLALAKAFKEKKIGTKQKRFYAIKMIEAACRLIENALEDPNEKNQIRLMAILKEEIRNQSELGHWINDKPLGLPLKLVDLESKLDISFGKQFIGTKERVNHLKSPLYPSTPLSLEQQQRFNKIADQLNDEINTKNESESQLEENYEKNPITTVPLNTDHQHATFVGTNRNVFFNATNSQKLNCGVPHPRIMPCA